MGFLDKFLKAAVDINNAANGGLSEMYEEDDDCPECGHPLRIGEKYKLRAHICDKCGFFITEGWSKELWDATGEVYEDDDYDDMPEECKACGGPYPDCYTSCDLMDDD